MTHEVHVHPGAKVVECYENAKEAAGQAAQDVGIIMKFWQTVTSLPQKGAAKLFKIVKAALGLRELKAAELDESCTPENMAMWSALKLLCAIVAACWVWFFLARNRGQLQRRLGMRVSSFCNCLVYLPCLLPVCGMCATCQEVRAVNARWERNNRKPIQAMQPISADDCSLEVENGDQVGSASSQADSESTALETRQGESFFGCLDDVDICLMAVGCPCHLFGQAQAQAFSASCCAYACCLMIAVPISYGASFALAYMITCDYIGLQEHDDCPGFLPAGFIILNFPMLVPLCCGVAGRQGTRAILHDQPPAEMSCKDKCFDLWLYCPCFVVPFGLCALAQQARAVKRQWIANGQEPLVAGGAERIDWNGEHGGEPNWFVRPVMPIPPIAPSAPAITVHNPACGK